MIITQEAKLIEADKTAVVTMFADTKDEVTDDVKATIPEGYKIAQGSTIMTANGELAFRKSDDTWNWV